MDHGNQQGLGGDLATPEFELGSSGNIKILKLHANGNRRLSRYRCAADKPAVV